MMRIWLDIREHQIRNLKKMKRAASQTRCQRSFLYLSIMKKRETRKNILMVTKANLIGRKWGKRLSIYILVEEIGISLKMLWNMKLTLAVEDWTLARLSLAFKHGKEGSTWRMRQGTSVREHWTAFRQTMIF